MRKAYDTFRKEREFIDELDAIDPEIIEDVFGIRDDLEKEQLMALTAIIKNDVWMDNPLVFEDLVLILNGISPSVLEFEGVSVPYIWYALFIMKKFRPDLSLGELVKGYIQFEHAEEGFYIYPRESGMKTPLKDSLTEILSLTSKDSFDEFNILENQASKVVTCVEYIKYKIAEDDIW